MDQNAPTPEVQNEAPEVKTFTRDQIRTAILDNKSEDVIVEVFGVKIEIRAPDLKGLVQYRDAQNDDSIMARSIINSCFIPGTGEQVFDDADLNTLMAQKFSPDMRKLIKAVNEVLGGDQEVDKAIEEQRFPATS